MMKRSGCRRAAALVLAAAMLSGMLAGCGAPAGTDSSSALTPAEYKKYTMVVTAWDTPNEVLDAVAEAGITPVEYYDGSPLLLASDLAGMGDKVNIYLCEGTYEAGAGDFIQTDGGAELTVTGAGTEKTRVIAPSGGTRTNSGAAVSVSGGSRKVTIESFAAEGFDCGVRVKDASNVTLRNLLLKDNLFAGVRLEGARDCTLENCTLEGNGLPQQQDMGWGLSLDSACTGNRAENVTYRNNGHQNAVDFPVTWESSADGGNAIELSQEYALPENDHILRDPVSEMKNARPTENALRFECEEAGYDEASPVTEGNMETGSEGGYLFLFGGSITMRVNIPKAGNYRLFVVGGSDDGNNKCDYVQINDGPTYLTAYYGKNQGKWTLSQPGTEMWVNNELTPQSPAEGFALQEGENVITITANWGYCAYDCIYLEEIDAA